MDRVDERLWEEYEQTHSPEIRNRILMAYLDIVKINARKMHAIYKNHAELEDVVNQGVLVLMECIEKFDWRRGIQFDSYASIRVRGSIIDYNACRTGSPRDSEKIHQHRTGLCGVTE
jgi:RNA polymerase sigma factor for flagellar operon FliA